jgi:hypothetical protein
MDSSDNTSDVLIAGRELKEIDNLKRVHCLNNLTKHEISTKINGIMMHKIIELFNIFKTRFFAMFWFFALILLLLSINTNSAAISSYSPSSASSVSPSLNSSSSNSSTAPTISPTAQSLGAHSNGVAAGLIVGVFLILGIGIAINAGEKKSFDEQSKINSSFSKLDEAQELEEK